MPASKDPSLQNELGRIFRIRGRALAWRHALRLHFVILIAACVLAFVSRVFTPLPGLELLHGRWIPTMFVAFGLLVLLYALHALLRLIYRMATKRDAELLASRLEKRFKWNEDATTALALDHQECDGPIARFLLASTAGRLRAIHASKLWPLSRRMPWIRGFLVICFAFILLGPGVDGLRARMGIGRGEPAGIGATDSDPEAGAPQAFPMATWLRLFVEEPVRVEPLPPENEPPKNEPDIDAPNTDTPNSDTSNTNAKEAK